MKKIIVFLALAIISLSLAATSNPILGVIAGVFSAMMYALFFEDGINGT